LIHNLSLLQHDLLSGVYRHGGYRYFRISDPKPREIHKASVRDRVLHHVMYRALYPYFDRRFIHDSYSCRVNKGAHRALRRFADLIRAEGRNNTRTVWVLSCDIKKCFSSIDHRVLKEMLATHISDTRILTVLGEVIDSFSSDGFGAGIPLGNLTSQLFVNIYLDALDHHMKEVLKVRRYIRYADDFVVLSHDKAWLEELLPRIACFVEEKLHLRLHPNKISLRTAVSGVDFLGWVHFPDHRVLRTTSKRRMLELLGRDASRERLASYRGLLKQGNAFRLGTMVESVYGTQRETSTRNPTFGDVPWP
jgi:RNA-directed DNA polymerase